MLNRHDIPGDAIDFATVAGLAATGGTVEHIVWQAPYKCKVHEVAVVPTSAVAGADTDYFNLNVIKVGSGGTGGTELANKDFVSGTNANAGLDCDLYSSALGTAFEQGEAINLQVERKGSGLAMPFMLVKVRYRGD